jgi:retinol dehydrogenase 12
MMQNHLKTYVVTGTTSGIGFSTAENLARNGAIVIGIGRSAERCRLAQHTLRQTTNNANVYLLTADLSTQSGVRGAADQIGSILHDQEKDSIDGLVNNAGVFTWWMALTEDGYETQWALNALAPFLLTRLLLPYLQRSQMARVVTVSSDSHYAGFLKWSDLQLRRSYNGLAAYQNTKLANILFTVELNRQLSNQGNLRAFAADPGLVNTMIGGKGTPALIRWFWGLRSAGGTDTTVPAAGIVYLLTEPSIQNSPHHYWKDCRPKQPAHKAVNHELAMRLWQTFENQCALDLENLK